MAQEPADVGEAAPARSKLVAIEWRAWWGTQRPMSRLSIQLLKPLWNQL